MILKHKDFEIQITFDEDDSIKPKGKYVSWVEDINVNTNGNYIEYMIKEIHDFFQSYLNSFNNLPPTNMLLWISTNYDDNWLEGDFSVMVKIVSYWHTTLGNVSTVIPNYHFKSHYNNE